MIGQRAARGVLATNINDVAAKCTDAKPLPACLLNDDPQILVLEHVITRDTAREWPGQQVRLGCHTGRSHRSSVFGGLIIIAIAAGGDNGKQRYQTAHL